MADADLIIAAYGVVQRLVLIGCYVIMGFMQGYQPVASYAFGAKNEDRFHACVQFALKASLLLTVIVAALYIVSARPLIQLFNSNPAVIDYGAKLLISQVALYPAFGLCYMMTITFQTIGASPVWFVPVADPSGSVLCPVYSDAAALAGRQRHLFCPAGRGSADAAGLRAVCEINEKNSEPEYAA